MKKISLSLLLSFVMVFTFAAPTFASANINASTSKTNANTLGLDVKAAILIDASSGQVLYDANADEIRPPASMTKMMTEYIVLEEISAGRQSWDTVVTASHEAASTPPDGSQIYLAEGDQHPLKDLYVAMAVGSANDATIALACHIAGTEAAFVKMMNNTAKKLGMKSAKFTSATGLAETTVISARDLAKFSKILLDRHPEFIEYSSLSTYQFRNRDLKPIVNWNWMLESHSTNPLTPSLKSFSYPGVDGLKTGYINKAGYCFAGTVNKEGIRLISVVMGTSSKLARFRETAKLYNYAYTSFEKYTVAKKYSPIKGAKTAKITKGVSTTVAVGAAQPVSLLVRKGIKPVVKQTDVQFISKDKLVAPIKKGQKVGSVTYSYKDPTSGAVTKLTTDLVATKAVEKGSWFRLLMRSIGGLFVDLYHSILDLF